MLRMKESDTVAVAISRYYVRASQFGPSSYCFRKSTNIRSDLVVLKMRETGIQHDEWSKMILRLSEAGLVAKWARIDGAPLKSLIEMDPDAGLITMEQYVGILGVFVAVYTLICFVAAFEHIVHYKMKQVGHHRFWNLADMAIDGQRRVFLFNRHIAARRRMFLFNRYIE